MIAAVRTISISAKLCPMQLCNVGLTVEEVSKRLGYTDPSTFYHAFKRWHGPAPSSYPVSLATMQSAQRDEEKPG